MTSLSRLRTMDQPRQKYLTVREEAGQARWVLHLALQLDLDEDTLELA